MMEQAKLIGVGCIGRPRRVARMLGKIMKSTRSSYVIPAQAGSEKDWLPESGATAGFCIGYDAQGLNLSLYACGCEGRPAKFSRCDLSQWRD